MINKWNPTVVAKTSVVVCQESTMLQVLLVDAADKVPPKQNPFPGNKTAPRLAIRKFSQATTDFLFSFALPVSA